MDSRDWAISKLLAREIVVPNVLLARANMEFAQRSADQLNLNVQSNPDFAVAILTRHPERCETRHPERYTARRARD
jgi:hypothetical protein